MNGIHRTIMAAGLLLLAACAAPKQDFVSADLTKDIDTQVDANLIYGNDNRIENYQASSGLQSLAASTVALVQSSKLSKNSDGLYKLSGANFGIQYQLCSSEPFREQVTTAFCSGSLVGDDVVLTAGHCITGSSSCSSTRFLFDFALKDKSGEKRTFAADDIYSCKEIIYRVQNNSGADFAVIRLDRKVVGRKPLAVRTQGVVSVGDSLVVIGHPAGLPQKIASGAQVRDVRANFFIANLDTYGGNSGSAIFNASSGKIEGVLVRGDTDFVTRGSCAVSNQCTDSGCRGEDVTRIDQVLPYLPHASSTPDPVTGERFSSNVAISIPDAPHAGIVSSINASSAPKGRQIQVAVNIEHTYRGDLLIELVAPDGQVVILQNRTGGSLDNVQGTFGDDLQSAQSLSALSKLTVSGKWSLRVTDKVARDLGVLKSWSLIFAQ